MAIDNVVFMNFMMGNMFYIIGGLGILVLIMYIVIINIYLNVSHMQKRYKKMMNGTDGANIEHILMGHIDEVREAVQKSNQIEQENKRLDAMVKKSLHKVGVVRFSAFDGIGSDLSYAVALLDDNNNGIILSSLFGREESRTYAKPIVNGASSYTLTDEELQALAKARE